MLFQSFCEYQFVVFDPITCIQGKKLWEKSLSEEYFSEPEVWECLISDVQEKYFHNLQSRKHNIEIYLHSWKNYYSKYRPWKPIQPSSHINLSITRCWNCPLLECTWKLIWLASSLASSDVFLDSSESSVIGFKIQLMIPHVGHFHSLLLWCKTN